MIELWKAIKGFDRIYDISNYGRLRTYRKSVKGQQIVCESPQKLMRPSKDKNGYLIATLKRDGKNKYIKLHRAVLEAFVGECPVGMECCHKNDIKDDNRVCNLKWDTHKNNQVKYGGARKIIGKGEKNPAAIFTDRQVIAMRQLAAKNICIRDIATATGASYQNVYRIIKGYRWSS